MKYVVEITDCGPLSFRAGRDTARATTLDYVPGTALFGGLAAAHVLLRHDPAQFDAFFMSDAASFSNLYPAAFQQDALQGNDRPVYPLPVTARSCKRFSGFKFDQESERKPQHGVYDTLIPWALFALSGQTNARALNALKDCECGEPRDAFGGFYRRDLFQARQIGTTQARRGLRTRTGINRATGTVAQGILYSREVLRAGTPFWGTLTVAEAEAEAFYAFVEEASARGLLRLGNNRTRGLGRVSLKLSAEAFPEDTQEPLAERIQTFDAALRQQARTYGVATPHALYVPLTLTSDAIVFDSLLRYRRTLAPDYLAETWGLQGAEVVYQNSGTRQVMGWNDLWRLPKPDDVAMTMGAVFLLGFSGALNATMLAALLQMQIQGIGARRREGFGRLVVANPFHWEVQGL